MTQSILMIDPMYQHRQVIRRFIDRAYPEVRLVERVPTSFDQVAASVQWADYDLLLIDNQLGNEDGFNWVERFKSDQNFPPVIFLSSTDIDSTGANKKVETGLRLGAQGFLFKKHMNTDVLSDYLSEALSIRTGRLTKAALRVSSANDEFPPTIAKPKSSAMKDTYHEVQHAKALLHGHGHWPFSVQDLQAGQAEYGGYRITSYLGRRDGIFTFVGQSLSDEKTYAIKLIEHSLTEEALLENKLRQDFDRILDWRHPHIVHWIDYQQDNEHLLIVQEFIQGEKLSHRLRKTGVTRAQAVTYFMQIMQALSHLHKEGMKAGGLSPENLLFRSYDELVLTHFNNLGELLESSQTIIPQSQRTYPEALYLSPEIIQGRSFDHRSDLYIAGVILYSLMAGRPPYDEGTTKAVLTDHVASPVPLLQERKHPLNNLIQGLMEKIPGKRIQTADEVLDMLERLIVQGKVASL